MSNLKKALSFGLAIGISLNLLGFTVEFFLHGIEKTVKDFSYIGFVSLPLFIIPCTISAYMYNKHMISITKKNILNTIRLSILWSFLIQFIIVFCFLYLKNGLNISYFIVSIFNGILAIFVALGSGLIYYLTNNVKPKTSQTIKFYYSKKHVLIISLILSSTFSLITYITGNSSWGNILLHVTILIKSLIASFIIIEILQYLYNSNKKSRNIFIGLTYFVVLIFFSIDYSHLISNNKYLGFSGRSVFFMMTMWIPYFLILCLSIHSYFIYNLNKVAKENLKKLTLESTLKYQHLKSQLSPHFLFNNISVLTGLIEENQAKAILFSKDLAEIYRYFLDQENKDLVTLDEELNFAKRYLNLLQIRFEDAIIVKLKNNTNSEKHIIPLALQQLIENIIKHNEVSQENNINITITTTNNHLEISNNINPKSTVIPSNTSGIENIKKRFKYFTNEPILVEENKDNFKITLPLITVTN